jgi:hypothetical protein
MDFFKRDSASELGWTWVEKFFQLEGWSEREAKELALGKFMRGATCCYKRRSQAALEHWWFSFGRLHITSLSREIFQASLFTRQAILCHFFTALI